MDHTGSLSYLGAVQNGEQQDQHTLFYRFIRPCYARKYLRFFYKAGNTLYYFGVQNRAYTYLVFDRHQLVIQNPEDSRVSAFAARRFALGTYFSNITRSDYNVFLKEGVMPFSRQCF